MIKQFENVIEITSQTILNKKSFDIWMPFADSIEIWVVIKDGYNQMWLHFLNKTIYIGIDPPSTF